MKRLLIGLVMLAIGLAVFSQRVAIREFLDRSSAPDLPVAEGPASTNTPGEAGSGSAGNTTPANVNAAPAPLPTEKNLKVPFTTQAPLVNWDHAHDEACEEASSLMVAAFWQGSSLVDKAANDAKLLAIEDWEVERFGYYEDTTASETATILRDYFNFDDVEVVTLTSWEQVKRELAAGRPVIVPAAGRELGNPNFRSPGPIYHNVVIKGYTRDGTIITNDPGTRNGADYTYDADVLWNAIHDWTGQAADGAKVMVVVHG